MADKQSRVPCPAIIGFTSKLQQTSRRMGVRDSLDARQYHHKLNVTHLVSVMRAAVMSIINHFTTKVYCSDGGMNLDGEGGGYAIFGGPFSHRSINTLCPY